MKDRRVELRVKIKSLAEEARIIRREERKAKNRGDYQLFHRLQQHRRTVVRSEARYSQLAYRTITSKGEYPKAESETKTRTPIDFDRVGRLCAEFGPVWDYDNETRPEFEARASTLNHLRAGMLMALKHLNTQSVAAYHASQPARAAANFARWQKYQQKHGKAKEFFAT